MLLHIPSSCSTLPILRKADSAKFWRGKKLEREPLIGVNSSRSAQAKYLANASGPNLSKCSFLMTDDLRPMVWPPSLFTADGGDVRTTPVLGRGLDAWPLRNRCCSYRLPGRCLARSKEFGLTGLVSPTPSTVSNHVLSEWSPKLGRQNSKEMLVVVGLLLFEEVPKGGMRAT